MSLSDGCKTRHESKLLYRKDHMPLRPSHAVEQASLPDTFTPTPFDPSCGKELPATPDCGTKAELGDDYGASKYGQKVDMIEAAPSEVKAAVRSDPNPSKSKHNYFYHDSSGSASACEPEPKECFECGQRYLEKYNAPSACVYHWGKSTHAATYTLLSHNPPWKASSDSRLLIGILINRPYQRNPPRGRRRARRRHTLPLSGRVWVWDCCGQDRESKGCYVRSHVAYPV
ncbi:hypothetical protein PG994_012243 [Apiospora phragmitis]|uniref:Uncharacterized protein n=1 Tax=Apiospora phragmitis TaxID=2905665 RepID=A0ABR1TVD1_9PEZI